MRPALALVSLSATLALAGCGHLPWQARQSAPPPKVGPVGPSQASQASALDTTTAAQKQAALAAGSKGALHRLGATTASLGADARQGFWLRTALVTQPEKGRVELGSKRLAVDLLPGTGPKDGGSQLSLGAYRALGLSLTDLPKLTVYGP
ncbi:hypothetical protein [Acidimangrovimonas sediminis]|uniref:hypothetical protein n=1 Tax=Acidimangrovimonas sediminis TaxID=2056283 RepID=UPI000C805BA4|nr:hypothetical protein [Acidimangrovimonas sediminis]